MIHRQEIREPKKNIAGRRSQVIAANQAADHNAGIQPKAHDTMNRLISRSHNAIIHATHGWNPATSIIWHGRRRR